MQSTQSKIDALLGITSTFDDYLDELSTESVSEQFKNVDDGIQSELSSIDCQLTGDLTSIDTKMFATSLANIDELIGASKKILKHVHSCIVTTDLCDSELIQAFSKLLEAAHVTISEYISLYKNRLAFFDKIKLMTFQQQQKKELMDLKHKMDLEKMRLKNEQGTIDAESGKVEFDQRKIIDVLDDMDKTSLAVEPLVDSVEILSEDDKA